MFHVVETTKLCNNEISRKYEGISKEMEFCRVLMFPSIQKPTDFLDTET